MDKPDQLGLRWTAAPRHTQWGAGMMEALVPLGNDHTLRLYVEAGALHLVGPALSGTNRDAPADEAADAIERLARALRLVMSCAGDIDAASDASLESALECDDEATRKQANAWLVARQALRGPNVRAKPAKLGLSEGLGVFLRSERTDEC